MKKIILGITVLVIVIAGWVFLRRTPESILQKVVKSDFGVNMKEINPIVTHFDEQWCPNGDGYCHIVFKYEGDHLAFFEQFNQLPIKEDLSAIIGIPRSFENLKQGYYMFTQGIEDPRDFMVLIIDPIERTGVLYYAFL